MATMATFSATVKLGNTTIKVESDRFLEVYEAVASMEELNDAMEGQDATLAVRPIKAARGNFKKYGFRLKDGRTLDLGMAQDQDKLVPLFPYNKHSKDYKGFQAWRKEDDDHEDDSYTPQHKFSTIKELMDALKYTDADRSIVRGWAAKCFNNPKVIPSELTPEQLTTLYNFINASVNA